MATDPRKLRPGELCRLLNSTLLGEVIGERQLHRHRTRAGLRIGDGRHVDLVRYVAWLVHVRHAPKPDRADDACVHDLLEAAEGAAGIADASAGNGQKLTQRQKFLIAALLTQPTLAAAARSAGIGRSTAYRWLQLPELQAVYRQARRVLVDTNVGRAQAATGQAIDVLLTVAKNGRRDSDRVRAAIALYDRGVGAVSDAEALGGDRDTGEGAPLGTSDVVATLSARLRELDRADLPTAEKSRLTATLTLAILRAIGVDVLDKRLEALQSVLLDREDRKR